MVPKVFHMKPSNLKDLDCNSFFVFSGHKVFAPMGIGVVYGKSEPNQLPHEGGGDMIDQVSFKETSFAPSPQRFEAGNSKCSRCNRSW